MSNDRGYEVGYGKPPRKNQFQKGVSGNPRGRPNGRKSYGEMISGAIFKKVHVNVAGELTKMTAIEAVFFRLMTEALKGNPRSIALLLKLLQEAKVFEPKNGLGQTVYVMMPNNGRDPEAVEKYYGGTAKDPRSKSPFPN